MLRSRSLAFSVVLLATVGAFSASHFLRADDKQVKKLPPVAKKKIDFSKDIAPIFAKHCNSCHGSEMQEAGLRLDLKTAFLGDSGLAIQAGKSAESSLIQYVAGIDPEMVMPPEGDPLTIQQVGLLRAWIDQGANWPKELDATSRGAAVDHWAFKSIKRPALPKIQQTGWIQNPIDAFVLAKLEKANIKPSAEANRITLIRRLSLDLLGLLPTPEEIDRFVDDREPGAYERLVDRLLASKHFGERWGRHWLDLARYADSDGYEKDRPRPNAWRWRDWVIDAINRDMPFDQFTIEQIAGDLLPNATEMQKLATAFHRQTLTNTEGGTDKEQFRVEAIFDRVSTTGTVWLGMTLGCAQCHSHKYDPISQNEYYRLFAFFDNGDETNTNVHISDVAVAKYKKDKAVHDKQMSGLDTQLALRRQELEPGLNEFRQQLQTMVANDSLDTKKFHPLESVSVKSDGEVTFTKQEDGSFLVAAEKNPDKAKYTVTASSSVADITGFRLEVLPDSSLPKQGPGRSSGGNFVLGEIQVFAANVPKIDPKKNRVALRAAIADFSQEKFAAAMAFDGDEKTGWAVGSQTGKPHSVVFKIQKPIKTGGVSHLQLILSQQYGSKHTLGRFRVTVMTGDDPRDDIPTNVRQILATAVAKRDEKQKIALLDFSVSRDDKGKALLQQIDALKKKAPKEPIINVRVVSQRTTNPRTTHIMRRGNFLEPQAAVKPGTLSAIHSLKPRKQGEMSDRLDLAGWLVDPKNPLTPRVRVNYIWMHLFGKGLVGTVNDFGVRGDKPTHPLLLDWLADEFIQRKWSRKTIVKLIVMSATYRQSSYHRPELAEIDPNNGLLYRQNRFRVEAEIVRDITLSASGLLSAKTGGPSVFPPMPADIAALSYANNFRWKTSLGEDRFRRGMYTFFKRTAPHPNLTMFDCPDSNTTCFERTNSNTPLQALTTLNNDVFVEASQALAKRLLTSQFGSDKDRISYAFRLCLARQPTKLELAKLLDLLTESRKWYQTHPEDAKKLVGSYQPGDTTTEETASLVATTRIIMNFDEFITRE